MRRFHSDSHDILRTILCVLVLCVVIVTIIVNGKTCWLKVW